MALARFLYAIWYRFQYICVINMGYSYSGSVGYIYTIQDI